MSPATMLEPELAPLDAVRVSALEWSQPRRFRQRVWELRADGEPVATLRWRGPWRRGYDARTARDAWEIRGSFLGRRTIRRTGEAPEIAGSNWKGIFARPVKRAAGEALVWRGEGWTGATHVLENREKFRLFRVRRRLGFLSLSGRVELEDAARTLPDLEPLLLLAWSLTIDRSRQHAH